MSSPESKEKMHMRLSDRIVFALDLALQQEDFETSQQLLGALDLAMTRNSGGGEFIERRDYPEEIEQALIKFHEIKNK